MEIFLSKKRKMIFFHLIYFQYEIYYSIFNSNLIDKKKIFEFQYLDYNKLYMLKSFGLIHGP